MAIPSDPSGPNFNPSCPLLHLESKFHGLHPLRPHSLASDWAWPKGQHPTGDRGQQKVGVKVAACS